jgi:hypothetical protein
VLQCKCGTPITRGDECDDCLLKRLQQKQKFWINRSKNEEVYRTALHRKKMRPHHHT